MICIGIDPGTTGAIALNINGAIEVCDLPIKRTLLKTKTKKGHKKTEGRLDYEEFRKILKMFSIDSADIIVFEKVHSMPGNSPSTSFTFGRIVGALEGVLTGATDTEITYVTPQAWKKYFNLTGKEKVAAAMDCRDRYPGQAEPFLKTKDGRADAALLAEYGRFLLTKRAP